MTTYGADAVTGVVNFITRKDFAGVDLSIGEQINERGDGNYMRADLTVGANFDDGRGNAVISIGYQESDPVYQGARDFSVFGIDSSSGTLGGSGTGVPSRITNTRPLLAGVPSTVIDPLGNGNGGTRQVNPATGAAVGTFAFFNFNPYNIFQTPFKRYNIYSQANYKVTDDIEVYARGLFSKNTVDTIIAPSGSFGSPVTMNLNNPFMPATLRGQFCAFNTASAGAYVPLYTPAVCAAAATATGPTDPNYRTVNFNLARRAVEVGPRISNYQTTIFDYRIGLRGAISPSISWDLSASYGESEKVQAIKNYTLQSRWRQALLANNTTTCITNTGGCVPVNPFGEAGSISAGAADFLSDDSTTTIRTSLSQVRGVVSGDLGFGSPGANEPIGFAVGGEYRKYRAQQSADVLAKTPGELGGAGGAAPDIIGSYDVYEGFAELIAPLIEDKPGFKSLTLEGGARYSRYGIDGGPSNTTWTYKVGLSWEPVADVKFRGNYARAVRAPNIGELFSPVSTGLTTLNTDPCAGTLAGNPGLAVGQPLRAVCLAQGAPVGTIGSILQPTAAQANSTGGGNINLLPETAKTWTVGAVFQPQALSGFSLSVDYYNIRVKGAITAPTSGDVMNACFGSLTAASAASLACTTIRRNPVTGGLDGDPSTTLGLPQSLSNAGELFTDGVDVVASYSKDLGFAKWQSGFVLSYTHSQTFNAFVASSNSVTRECVGLYSADCGFTGSIQPKWQWSWRNTMSLGNVDVSLLWRHVAGVTHETGGLFTGTIAGLPGNLSSQAMDFNSIPAYNWFDLSARFNVNENFTLTVTVQNLFDKQPPIVGSTAGTTSFNSGNTYPSTYDALGRRFAASARIRF